MADLMMRTARTLPATCSFFAGKQELIVCMNSQRFGPIVMD